MSELSPPPDTPLGLYRHYKGGEYEVLGVARDSETQELLVVYRPRGELRIIRDKTGVTTVAAHVR